MEPCVSKVRSRVESGTHALKVIYMSWKWSRALIKDAWFKSGAHVLKVKIHELKVYLEH